MRGLLIGDEQLDAIRELRERASAMPIDMKSLLKELTTKAGIAAHRKRMTALSIELPIGFLATYSVETGHPCGTARHLSVSIDNPSPSRPLPHPFAVWQIAKEFGFTGSLEHCAVWVEKLQKRGEAVNVVQPLTAGSIEEC